MSVYETCRPSQGGTPKCGLGKTCKRIQLPGKRLSSRGVTTPLEYFIVIAAPEWLDDKKGSIGNGRGIPKLIEFLDKAKIDKDKVYLTSLVKCAPPKRKPSIQEIKACIPHIAKELHAIKPKIVILLGNETLKMFNLNKAGGLKAIRGQILENRLLPDAEGGDDWSHKFYTIMPTYDPSTLLYSNNIKLERKILSDYRRAKTFVESGEYTKTATTKPSFNIISNRDMLRTLIEQIKKVGIFAFDTESRSLDWNVEPLICLSFTIETRLGIFSLNKDPYINYILPIYKHNPAGKDWKLAPYWKPAKRVKDSEWAQLNDMLGMSAGYLILQELKEVFEDPSIDKIAHNIKYDMNVLRKHGDIQIKGKLYDTMLMHHALLEEKPHSLAWLSDIELNIPDYDKEIKKITGKGKKLKYTYDYIPDRILYPYAALDAQNTYGLYKIYKSELDEKPHLWSLYNNEIEPAIRTFADAEWYGTKLDRNIIEALSDDYQQEREQLLSDMRAATFPEFNPGSPDQVAKVVIDAGLGDRIVDKSKTSGYCTDKERLLKIRNELSIADKIVKFRNINKMISTYLVNAKKDMDDNDRLRVTFWIHGTETGRPSCRFLHQIPRVDLQRTAAGKHNMREMFVCEDGRSLVYFDYSQIELRVLAEEAQDYEMMRLFADGEDIHVATAACMIGIPDEKVNSFNRQNCGKMVNFGLAYGSEGFQLLQKGEWEDEKGNRHPISWSMLQTGMRRFNERFSGVAEFLGTVPDIARRQGCVYVTRFGRERRIGDVLLERDRYTRKKAEREITNFSIQSPASSINIRTLNMVNGQLISWMENGSLVEGDIFLINTVHDSGTYDVANKYVGWFMKALKGIAERVVPEYGMSFPVDIGTGKSWAEAEADSKS